MGCWPVSLVPSLTAWPNLDGLMYPKAVGSGMATGSPSFTLPHHVALSWTCTLKATDRMWPFLLLSCGAL